MPEDPSGVTNGDHGDGGGEAQDVPGLRHLAPSDPLAGLPAVTARAAAPMGHSNGRKLAHHDSAEPPPPPSPVAVSPLALGDSEAGPGGSTSAAGGADHQPLVDDPTVPAAAPGLGAGLGSDETTPETLELADDSTLHPAHGARSGRRGRRRTARRGLRVHQRLWSIDPWSVFKLSALFYVCLCLVLLVAGTLLWNVGRSVGTVDQVESFITRMGAYGTCTPRAEVPSGTDFEPDDDCPEGEVLVGGFTFDDGTLFRTVAIGGSILVVGGAIGNVLLVVLVNLLNEVTGGLRHTVIREPVPRTSGPRRRAGRPRGAHAVGVPGHANGFDSSDATLRDEHEVPRVGETDETDEIDEDGDDEGAGEETIPMPVAGRAGRSGFDQGEPPPLT